MLEGLFGQAIEGLLAGIFCKQRVEEHKRGSGQGKEQSVVLSRVSSALTPESQECCIKEWMIS